MNALSRLNLPNCDEDNMAYAEKIINSVDLQFDSDMEILEFHEMIEAMEAVVSEEEPQPVELKKYLNFLFKPYPTLRVKPTESSVLTNRARLPRLKVRVQG